MTTLVGTCVGETTDLPIRQDADIDTSGVKCCLDSRRVMQTAVPCPAPGTWVPAVHAKCHHNEVAALLKRSLAPTPTPVPGQEAPVLAVFRTLRRVAGRYRGQRWGYLETAQSYSAVKKLVVECRYAAVLGRPSGRAGPAVPRLRWRPPSPPSGRRSGVRPGRFTLRKLERSRQAYASLARGSTG
jgi:hypothetical protein